MTRLVTAEIKKILTVRSTYVIFGICLAATIFFAFYVTAFRLNADVTDPGKLAGGVTAAVSLLSALIILIGILLATHEYRYNTIMYTLSSANSRLKVLLAKIIAVSIVAILLTIFFAVLSPVLTYLGLQLKGLELAPQTIPIVDLLWRSVFFGWGNAMFALLLAFIIRNQVGAIIAIYVVTATIEGLLFMLLKDNAKFLPATSLNIVLQPMQGIELSPGTAALIAFAWLLGLTILAVILFKRRDAN